MRESFCLDIITTNHGLRQVLKRDARQKESWRNKAESFETFVLVFIEKSTQKLELLVFSFNNHKSNFLIILFLRHYSNGSHHCISWIKDKGITSDEACLGGELGAILALQSMHYVFNLMPLTAWPPSRFSFSIQLTSHINWICQSQRILLTRIRHFWILNSKPSQLNRKVSMKCHTYK